MSVATANRKRISDDTFDFLRDLRPKGRLIAITTIIPDGPTTTRTFTNPADACEFVEEQNRRGRNCYYTLNLTGPANVKPRKADVTAVMYLHVDADPSPDETPEAFKNRTRKSLRKFEPAPTFIVDSGNGLQILWELRKPFPIQNDDDIAAIESRNHALAVRLGADPSTRNVDRLLRVAGSINFPNAKKKRDGRVECLSRYLSCDETAIYRLEDFPEQHVKSANEKKPIRTEHSNGDLPKQVAALLHLKNPDHAGFNTRSGLFRSFLMSALRANVDEGLIISTLLDKTYAGKTIYEHIHEAGGQKRHEYVARQLSRARDKLDKLPDKRILTTRRLDQFARRKTLWLWWPFIARREMNCLYGDSGVGKSSLAYEIIARVTTGKELPCFGNEASDRAPLGSVLIMAAEDSPETVIGPRLKEAGADMSKVHLVGYDIPDDPADFDPYVALDQIAKQLEEKIKAIGDVKLVYIDPITDFAGRVNVFFDSEARQQMLQPLLRLARRYKLAVVFVLHTNKKNDLNAKQRAQGAGAFINMPRSAILVGRDPNDYDRRIIVQAKTNLSREKAAAFRMTPTHRSIALEWEHDWVDMKADDLLTGASKPNNKKESAEDLLEELLADGPKRQREVVAAAKAVGISERTLERARKSLKMSCCRFSGQPVKLNPAFVRTQPG
jgi:hypothetical protein